MTSFFRFVNKRVIYRLGIISLAHASVHATDLPVVNEMYMLMNYRLLEFGSINGVRHCLQV
jgi:hypothetical protein